MSIRLVYAQSMQQANKLSRRGRQSGQAIVFILLLTVIGVIGAIALVSTGILTSEKMQLQNAADATAYSVSVLEARDLNYGAYINRAMVANEVAIGQMVSMHSWVTMMKSEPGYLSAISGALNTIPGIGSIMSAAVNGYASYVRTISNAAYRVIDPLSRAISQGLNILNTGYGYSQHIMHMATLVFTASAIKKVPSANFISSTSEAKLSKFGWFALALHYGSYYGDLLKLPVYQFVKHPTGNDEHMQRFAQVVNDSRDGFTKNRSCSNNNLISKGLGLIQGPINKLNDVLNLIPFVTGHIGAPSLTCRDEIEGGWDMNFLNVTGGVKPFIGFEATAGISLGSDRRGGSQVEKGGEDNAFIWSATDGASLKGEIEGKVNFCWIVPKFSWPFYTRKCKRVLDETLPFPKVPYGAGSAYAGSEADLNVPDDLKGRDVMYGQLPNLALPWVAVKSAGERKKAKNLAPSYKLAPGGYQMITDKPDILDSAVKFSGMEAPYILIALSHKKEQLLSSEIAPKGNFSLAEADTDIAAIGKAEVYYSQPLTLGHRAGAANGFNPYWDARLVDTSYVDRIAALVFQSGQKPLPQEVNNALAAFIQLKKSLVGLF